MKYLNFDKWIKNNKFRVIFVGILLLLIQFLYSGYSVVCVLYVKNKYDPVLIILFRVIVASPVNLIFAIILEGKFNLWQKNLKFNLLLLFLLK